MTYTHVILVDENDTPIGEEEKLAAHQNGDLHRAFSIFIYRVENHKIEVLLQKRAANKYHCGGLWTNTCCSHPVKDKSMQQCLHERLAFEMGMEIEHLNFAGKFTYKSQCKGGLIEHEIDHVYVGQISNQHIEPNPEEVEAYQWMEISTLEKQLHEKPDFYTPWCAEVLALTKKHIGASLL